MRSEGQRDAEGPALWRELESLGADTLRGWLQDGAAGLRSRLRKAGKGAGYVVAELGRIGEAPTLLFRPSAMKAGPNILIASGFHGKEPAGPASCLLAMLREQQHAAPGPAANVSYLPLVSPHSLAAGTHQNAGGQDPNRGFCHTSSGQAETSPEGSLLRSHVQELVRLGRDGVLCLHEDVDVDTFYFYSFEADERPGSFTRAIRAAGGSMFSVATAAVIEGAPAADGIIYRYCDGSFEDWLFHEGVLRSACVECPGLLPLGTRIVAGAHLIRAVVEVLGQSRQTRRKQ